LTTITNCVGDNINKVVTLILDDWELDISSTSISTRILNLKECLQKDLENDEHFYKEVVNTSSARISRINDIHWREKNVSSKV
jgi:exosome complex RNA-binding protein Rrp4